MEKADDVCEGEDNNHEHEETNGNIREKNQSDNEDAEHGQPNVPPKLVSDDLVCLPSSVYLYVTKCSRNVGIFHNFFYFIFCWNMFFWTIKYKVIYFELGGSYLWCWLVANQFSSKFEIRFEF